MADHLIDPTLLIPDHVMTNYAEKVHSEANQLGTTVAEQWAAQIEDFKVQHEADGLAGWDHLAAWAETVDPEEYLASKVPDALAVRRMRVLESEKRDPTDVGAVFTPDEQEQVQEEVAHARRTSARTVFAGDDEDGPEDKRKQRGGAKPTRTAADSKPKQTA